MNSAGKVVDQLRSNMNCQPRLPASAGTRQCEESGGADQASELGQFMAATDEPRQVDG